MLVKNDPAREASASFAYRAARRDGVQEVGVVEAQSRDAAVALLARRELFPIEIRLENVAEERRARLSAADLALGLRMLATLLESGLPMSRALAALTDLVPASWRTGLPTVREAVRQGKSLAVALRDSPLAVPSLVIGIIQAGEAGGGVAAAVRRAGELTETTAGVQAAVRNALAYPLVLATAGIASVALLVGIVLPRFGAILMDLGQSLPASTRLVLGAAEVVRAGWLPGLVTAVLLAVAWRAWVARDAGRRRWHELLLSAPAIGPVRRSSATARACTALSALLDSGVAIAPALLHAAGTSGDAALTQRILSAREAVIAGESIARALEQQEAMTATAVRLIRTGEETGRLSAMLEHAARLETERSGQMVRTAVRLLEPMLILAFSALVALVAAALLQAVYSVRPGP